jgi:hypothetical protein
MNDERITGFKSVCICVHKPNRYFFLFSDSLSLFRSSFCLWARTSCSVYAPNIFQYIIYNNTFDKQLIYELKESCVRLSERKNLLTLFFFLNFFVFFCFLIFFNNNSLLSSFLLFFITFHSFFLSFSSHLFFSSSRFFISSSSPSSLCLFFQNIIALDQQFV